MDQFELQETPEGDTVEEVMRRLARGGERDVQLQIVNAGHMAEFYQVTVEDPSWFIAINRRRKTYGYGSGGSALAALQAAEASTMAGDRRG